MKTIPENVRGPRSIKVLWRWTGVSAGLHVLLIALLCGVSYWGFEKKEAADKARAATEAAAAAKAEAAEAAKTPPPVVPAPAPVPAVASPPPVQAEKILGIDKVAKPGETPTSPFAGGNDDLLKDLK